MEISSYLRNLRPYLNHPEAISELIQLVDNTKSTSRFYGIKQYFFMILYTNTERQYSTVVSSSSSTEK